MAKDSIFEKARRLNAWLDKEDKSVLVRRGKIVGFIGNEDRFYKKRKRKRKK
tara:strand:+ start:188 stop:343 length:156 start_codon:yes stop_codon:yes gene_type:complete